MQTKFHHHPDDHIIVSGDDGVYNASRVEFDSDVSALQLPAYSALPPDVIERQYSNGKHLLFSHDSQFAGQLPWAPGDAYIAALPQLLACMAARRPQAAPLPENDHRSKRAAEYPPTVDVISATAEVARALLKNKQPPAKAVAVLEKVKEIDEKYPEPE